MPKSFDYVVYNVMMYVFFRLLMDYPFIKQVSGDYLTHIASLTGRDSERQVAANTVRILLLEEQNTELREKTVPQTQSSEGQSYQVVTIFTLHSNCIRYNGLQKWGIEIFLARERAWFWGTGLALCSYQVFVGRLVILRELSPFTLTAAHNR